MMRKKLNNMILSYDEIKIKPKSDVEKLEASINLQLFRNKATIGLKAKVIIHPFTLSPHITIENANPIQLLIAQEIITKLTNKPIQII